MRRLIITNGQSAAERLRAAGMEDEILTWDDVLHDGPVPAGLPHEELSALRAGFLADDLALPHDRVVNDFKRRDASMRTYARYDRIELWFEHDLYDQLQLIQILDFFAREKRSEGLLLVQADDYLGLQPENVMRALANTAKPVTAQQTETACQAWAAFTGLTPEALADLTIDGETESLPYLRPALGRLLAELPDPAGGLSLTETRALRALAAGPQTVATLFKLVLEQEAARFLGDVSFFRRLDGLCFASQPLIEGLRQSSQLCAEGPGPLYWQYASTQTALTEVGHAALSGRFDHARENGIDRWLGGTHIVSGSLWRWDREAGRLVIS